MNKQFELSQSSLKDWEKFEDKEQWKKKWIDKIFPFERKESFIYGSLLDAFLFEPDVLDKKFVSYRGDCKPSDTLQGVIALSILNEKKMPFKEAFLNACRELQFGKTWKDDTLLKKLDGLEDYIDFCRAHPKKTVVLYSFAKNIQDIANYLVSHQPNKIYDFIVEFPSEDYTNEFQKTLHGKIDDVPIKVIIDILHFDEVNSTVRIVDFKTTYSTDKFKESIRTYGYDTQLSVYQEILKQNPDVYQGYTLIEPLNIVVAKSDLDIYIHNYFDAQLAQVKYGDPQKNIKGWLETVGEIKNYLNSIK